MPPADDKPRHGIDAPPGMVMEGFGVLSGRHKEGYTAHIGMAPESAELPILLVVANKGGAHIFKRLYTNEMMAQAGAVAQFGPGWKWSDCAQTFTDAILHVITHPRGRNGKREAALKDPEFLLEERYDKEALRLLCIGQGLTTNPKARKLDLAVLYVEAIGKDAALELLRIRAPKERS